jgi:hypothetical protein
MKLNAPALFQPVRTTHAATAAQERIVEPPPTRALTLAMQRRLRFVLRYSRGYISAAGTAGKPA